MLKNKNASTTFTRNQTVKIITLIIGDYNTIDKITNENFEYVMQLNFHGTVRTVQKYLPSMSENHGHVVLVGSQAGQFRLPTCSPYCVSKATLNSFAQSLNMEQTMARGATISIICPPDTMTPQYEKELKVRITTVSRLSPRYLPVDSVVDDIHRLLKTKQYTVGCNVMGKIINVLVAKNRI